MTETILEVKSILLELQQKPKTCQMCGSLLSSRHAKYCSKPCHDKSKLRQVEITCETCGIIFSVKKSRVKNRKYCSTKCMGNNPEWRERNSKSHKQEGIKIACELCGNVFIVNKSKVKTRTHCSQKCRNADPKWRKKLSDIRIKNFAEKKRLVREKAIQQRDNFNKIMTKSSIIPKASFRKM